MFICLRSAGLRGSARAAATRRPLKAPFSVMSRPRRIMTNSALLTKMSSPEHLTSIRIRFMRLAHSSGIKKVTNGTCCELRGVSRRVEMFLLYIDFGRANPIVGTEENQALVSNSHNSVCLDAEGTAIESRKDSS